MSRRFQLKQDQFKADKQQLEELVVEHDAITKQLGYENNAAERLRLERQQDDCRNRMDKLALKCDRLEKELQALEVEEKVLQTLIALLTPVNFETVTKVYQFCLSEGRFRPMPETLEALLLQIAEIPGDRNEPKPLLRFVSLLIQEKSLAAAQRDDLKAWAKTQGTPIQEESAGQLETAEICLMVKVQPRSQNDPSLGYLVSAAIAQDPNPWKSEVEPITTPITIAVTPDPKCAPGYSQDDLPRILEELIAVCGREHHIPLTDLIIQWFLPIRLMSLPVEHWQFKSGRQQTEYSGKRCKAVIIRSLDRHFLPVYQTSCGDWRKYWTRLLTCQEAKYSEALVKLNTGTGKTRINWGNARVVGCRFVEHDDPQRQEALWEELLGQGVPIALWTRQSETKRRMQSLSTCTISKLSESLANHRQKALSHDAEIDRLKAASLCLLLDNPFRPFPTLDYQSA